MRHGDPPSRAPAERGGTRRTQDALGSGPPPAAGREVRDVGGRGEGQIKALSVYVIPLEV